MEKTLKRIKPKYYWIVAFILGALSMYVMLSYSQMLSTGKYIILADDSLHLYVANIRMIAENVLHGESIWYSFANNLGMNTSVALATYCFNPFNLLYIIFSKADLNIITAAIIILKAGTAAAAFQIYASKGLKVHNYYSILFAIFYSMCSFAVIYGVIHFMWLDGLYILPIVALAVNKTVYEEKNSLLTLGYAYIFIVQFYQGFVIFVFSLMYFSLLVCLGKRAGEKKRIGKLVLKYIWSVVLSVVISAFILLPVFFAIRSFYTFDFSLSGNVTTLMQVFNNLYWGEIQNFNIAPYLYCGIPCILLLPFYFINQRISKNERIINGVLLSVFSIACILPPMVAFLHLFERVEVWNYRFGFILVFLLCCMACKEVIYIKWIKAKSIVLYCIFLILFFIVEGRLEKLEMGSISHNNLLGLAVNSGLLALWAGLAYIYIRNKKYRMTIAVLFIFVALLEVISNGCFCLSSSSYRGIVEREDFYYAWSEDMDYVMKEVRKGNAKGSFYRMIILGDYNLNSDALLGYNGLLEYGYIGNERTKNFLREMGLYAEGNRYTATGFTKSLEMLLSVRYEARLHTDMVVLGYDTKPGITENEDVLPIAFMAEDGVLEKYEMTNNSFENQNLIFKQLSGVENLYSPVANELKTRDEDGLFLSKEDVPVLYTDSSGTGIIVFRVSETDNPVYMQIASSVSPEERQGIFYDASENMTFSGDNYAWIPFTAKLWQSKDNHYLSLRADNGARVDYTMDNIYIYELNSEKMKEIEDSLKEGVIVPEIIKSGYVKGRVKVDGDRRVLFTSIPYEKGWKASVNNTDTECVPVLNNTFIGLILPGKGEYEIELKYHCPGAKAGAILSLAGIVLFVLQLVLEKKNSKR